MICIGQNIYLMLNMDGFVFIIKLFFHLNVTNIQYLQEYIWYKNDKTTNESYKYDGIASQFGLHQLINEPTHHTRTNLLVLI